LDLQFPETEKKAIFVGTIHLFNQNMKPIVEIRRIAIFLFLLFTFFSTAFSQSGDNPFDLKPRIEKPEEKVVEIPEAEEKKQENPFDIKGAKKETTSLQQKEEKIKTIPRSVAPVKGQDSKYSRFLFFMTIFSLGLFTAIITFFGKTLQKVSRAILNDNLLKQAFRAREAGQMFPYFMLYGIFFFNFGLFIFLLLKNYGILPDGESLRCLLYIIAGVFSLYMSKHIILKIFGTIFPVKKEASLYDFTIILFAILAGVLFLPANVLIAYTDPGVAYYILWGTIGIFVCLLLFRSFRGIFIGADFLNANFFHFLLYICTVEIAPALILIKLIQNQYAA